MSEHEHDHEHEPGGEPPSPEQDVAAARAALDEGDLEHAAHHVAGAIAADPENPEHIALLDELVSAAPDPGELAPLGDEAFFGTVGVRAWVLARLGRYDEAIDLLLQVIGVRPDVPFLAWLEMWLGLPGACEAIDPDRFAVSCQRCLGGLEQSDAAGTHGRKTLERLVATVAQVREAHVGCERLAFVHAILVRRTGDLDAAVDVARRAREQHPGYMSCVALAGAHRERDELEKAVDSFREALTYEPDDLGVRLDIGDLLLDLDRLDESLRAYEEVLAREPEHPWALPSSLYLKAVRDDDRHSEKRLLELADAEQDAHRARSLLATLRPYVADLPEPESSLVPLAHRALVEGLGMKRCSVSSLEAPSAVMALQQTQSEVQPTAEAVTVRFGDIPEPDPREPREKVAHRVWTYEGDAARPAVTPPPHEVSVVLAELAATPYALARWKRRAGRIAHRFGPDGAADLLAAMVHPAPRPEDITPWSWIFRTQTAAALALARLDGGWKGSVRRAALFSLLHGPTDWTTSAAILALAELARDEPDEAGKEIVDTLVSCLGQEPSPIWYACVYKPSVHGLLRVDWLPEEVHAALRGKRREILHDEPEGDGAGEGDREREGA